MTLRSQLNLFKLEKPKQDASWLRRWAFYNSSTSISIVCFTCEFLAEWSCDGSCFDQRCLANMFKILDFGHAVVVDKIVVFFG